MSCNPRMHTGILIKSQYAQGDLHIPHMHMGIDLNPRMHMGISVMLSPYAYGDQSNPRIHTGIKINPLMHTGITRHAIPVCIWGSRSIPVCIRGSIKSPYAYGGQDQSPYAYRDRMSCNPRMHMIVIVIYQYATIKA